MILAIGILLCGLVALVTMSSQLKQDTALGLGGEREREGYPMFIKLLGHIGDLPAGTARRVCHGKNKEQAWTGCHIPMLAFGQ